MARKGVSLIFEQVMLFVVGVVIFIISLSIFNTYERYYTETIVVNQIENIQQDIVSNLLTFYYNDEINSTLRMSVPEMVGSEHYDIRINQSGLSLTTKVSRKSSFAPLSRINDTFILSGGFSTVHGSEFLIYKRGNQIIIG